MKTKKTPTDPNLQGLLRKKVRDALHALPKGKMATDQMIYDAIRITFGLSHATPEDIDQAREWNHARNFVDYQHDHDLSRDQWFLTDKGRKHD